MSRSDRRASPGTSLLVALACWPGLVACGGDTAGSDPADASPRPETEEVRADLVELLSRVSPAELREGGALDQELDVNREVTALDRPGTPTASSRDLMPRPSARRPSLR